LRDPKTENPRPARGANLPGKSCELGIRTGKSVTSLPYHRPDWYTPFLFWDRAKFSVDLTVAGLGIGKHAKPFFFHSTLTVSVRSLPSRLFRALRLPRCFPLPRRRFLLCSSIL